MARREGAVAFILDEWGARLFGPDVSGPLDFAWMLERLGRSHPGTHWGRLLFSAKESVYKAWFPVTRRWLGFEQARLTIDPDAGTFHAALSADGTRIDEGPPLNSLHGRFMVTRGLIVTAVASER